MATFTQATLGDGELSNASKWYWRILKPISDAFAALIGDAGWTNATPLGSWTTPSSSPYHPIGYRKRGNVVWLRGSAAGGTVGQTVFTLPAGYRPALVLLCTGISSAAISRVDVTPAGSVIFTGNTAGTSGSCWFDGIGFVLG